MSPVLTDRKDQTGSVTSTASRGTFQTLKYSLSTLKIELFQEDAFNYGY